MKAYRLVIYFGVLLLLFSSCAPAYVPNVANTPLLKEKGDMQLNMNAAFSGFDPQFAVGVTNHLGLMINGSFANRTSDSTDNFHKHTFVEGGLGYYGTFGNQGRFEVYGGYGLGKIQAEYNNSLWETRSDVKLQRIFIQPAIGVSGPVFDASFSPRLVHVYLYQGANNNAVFFIEPIATTKVGYKYIKAVVQLGLSYPLENQDDVLFDYQPFIFSVGFQINLHELFNPQKANSNPTD